MTWSSEPIDGAVEVRVVADRPALPPALERLIATVWEAEVARRPRLFNGDVFSVERHSGRQLAGHWTEYRRIIAQLRRPDLADAIGARPLSVAGILEGPGGFLLGRRPDDAAYQPGLWQMAPAGNVDPGCASGDRVDVLGALLGELREEIGLAPDQVEVVGPLCLIHHPGIRIVDLGIRLRTRLSEADIRRAHRDGDGEYPALAFVTRPRLASFLEIERERVGPQVVPFLRHAGVPV